MMSINLWFIYTVGARLSPLEYLRVGTEISKPHNTIALSNAKSALDELLEMDAEDQFLVPNMVENAKELSVIVRDMLNAAEVSPKDLINKEISRQLVASLQNFDKDTQKDLGRLFVYAITDQRILSAKVLLETPHEILAEHLWNKLGPMAQLEIVSGSNCLAFDCYTASGFHFLRAVESIIRNYILAATKSLPQKRDWGHYGTILEQAGADPKVVTSVDQLRHTERNPLMHPEDDLDKDQAVDLVMLCVTTINRLVGDMEKKGLLSDPTV